MLWDQECVGGGGGGGGGGKNFWFPPPPPPLQHTKVHYNFATLRNYIFVSFQQVTFKFGNCINLKVLISEESTDFS